MHVCNEKKIKHLEPEEFLLFIQLYKCPVQLYTTNHIAVKKD